MVNIDFFHLGFVLHCILQQYPKRNMNFVFWTKLEVADFIEAKKEVTFKVDLILRNSVGTY